MKLYLALCLVMLVTVLGAAQQPAAPASPQTQPKTGAPSDGTASAKSQRGRPLTGRIVDEGGGPVEDALVVASPAGLMNSPSRTMTARIRPVSTDEQGRFEISDMQAGPHTLLVLAPGFVVAPGSLDEEGRQKYFRAGDTVNIRMIRGGVITGTVTSALGEPMVGVRVRYTRLRDTNGKPASGNSLDFQQDWQTDDRGVYRIYGVQPGTYLVSAGGKGFLPFATAAYDDDAPTYYPSSPRATATEVNVLGGVETSGIDIKYRDYRGHAVTGTVTGAAQMNAMGGNFLSLLLVDAASFSLVSTRVATLANGAGTFAFDSVPDGDFIVVAMHGVGISESASLAARRVTVKGADLSGIDLKLMPFGSVAGQVTLEPLSQADARTVCQAIRKTSLDNLVVIARSDRESKSDTRLPSLFGLFTPYSLDSAPGAKGEFVIRFLEAGRFRLEPRFPTEDWYARSVTIPGDTPASKPVDLARGGFLLKPGDNLKGVSLVLAEGAAGLRGRVVPATEGGRLPDNLRVYLVPAEPDQGENPLRFAEAPAQADGTFELTNLAPGRYGLVVRHVTDQENREREPRPLAWDPDGRAGLRMESEALKNFVELTICKRVTDYKLRYSDVAAKPAPKH